MSSEKSLGLGIKGGVKRRKTPKWRMSTEMPWAKRKQLEKLTGQYKYLFPEWFTESFV